NLPIGKNIKIPKASVPEPSPEPNRPSKGGDNAEKVWEFFNSKGFSDEATAGIMGNLQLESGFDTRIVNKHSKAFGLGQWLGARLTKLKKWANDNGKDLYAIETQIEWVWEEINGKDDTTKLILDQRFGTIEALKKMNIDKAVRAFEESFERSGGEGMDLRKKYARENYNRFAKKTGVKTTVV
ncbi:phage tail tip lysozyme, partial [Bacillus thuringiensis]|uniref:phage tail tip lysozyme n=1 Tax=Bacillus thuringiensis TaxID=1428 RepID=UPI000BEB57AC